ncbi:MAG TPA: PGPGW domain-containing protein [Opitutaceae bacterium]|nr:PGPGW domain-containing protein [Opitutaceae bacterium]
MNQTEFLKSPVYRQFRRVVILITGGMVLLIGIALLVLPGPAIVVIPIGLSILALEFAWARRWKRRVRELWQRSKDKFGTSSKGSAPR